MQDNAKESCMVSFRLLYSHLTALSNNDSKGTCINGGFERASVVLFDQDIQTFTGLMLLNLDQIEKQLDKEEFQETGSIDAFRALITQFQTFINFQYYFDDFDGTMICKYFQAHTRTKIRQFRDTLIQHMESLRESILEREKHKREKHRRVNDRMMQSKERKDNSSNALDADLVITESNETESERHVLSSRSGNDTHTDDADINFMNNKQPVAKVQLSAEHNILADEQHHSEQSKSVYDTYLLEKVDRNTTPESTNMSHKGGEIDQNADDKKFDRNNILTKPVTPHYLPKVKESAPAKPHHVNAHSSFRNSKKESYGSNDMAQNYYLDEAKKKTQDKNRNLKPRKMPSAKTHHTPNACTPKPRSNNQTSRIWPASKSYEETLKAVQKVDHSKNPSSFSDFKHFVCSTC
nr:hypothetical protein [Tanacetum cinerariifolium]